MLRIWRASASIFQHFIRLPFLRFNIVVVDVDGRYFERNPGRNVATDTTETLPRSVKELEAEKAKTAVIEKMKSIVIPELEFREANIQDVIEFLQDASVEYDPAGKQKAQGVSSILSLPPAAGAVDDGFEDEFVPDEAEEKKVPVSSVPLITFRARYINLYEALQIATQVAGLKWDVMGSRVVITPRDTGGCWEMVVRQYTLTPTVLEAIEDGSGAPWWSRPDPDPDGSPPGWKDFFEMFGVTWPENTWLRYTESIGVVVICNSAQNVNTFGKVLDVFAGGKPRAGRYRLAPLRSGSGTESTLMLLDRATGQTWHYEPASAVGLDGKVKIGRWRFTPPAKW